MTNTAQIKPEWLEIIECCSAKVQMDLIRAIVAWQTDGTIPQFRSAKMAIFLIMVRDIDPKAATLIAAANAKPAKTAKAKPCQAGPDRQEPPHPAPDNETNAAEQHPEPHPAPSARKKKDPRRNFFPYGPLY